MTAQRRARSRGRRSPGRTGQPPCHLSEAVGLVHDQGSALQPARPADLDSVGCFGHRQRANFGFGVDRRADFVDYVSRLDVASAPPAEPGAHATTPALEPDGDVLAQPSGRGRVPAAEEDRAATPTLASPAKPDPRSASTEMAVDFDSSLVRQDERRYITLISKVDFYPLHFRRPGMDSPARRSNETPSKRAPANALLDPVNASNIGVLSPPRSDQWLRRFTLRPSNRQTNPTRWQGQRYPRWRVGLVEVVTAEVCAIHE